MADVVVENFRPSVMDRLGLRYETLHKRNSRLIYAASSGYGQTGPYAKRPGQDYIVQALTGAMWLTGRRDDPPFLFGVAIADVFSGVCLALGIVAALQHRNRTAEGQRVDIDLLSCMMAIQQQELTVFLNHHGSMDRPQQNISHAGLTGPSGVYRTSDGYLLLSICPAPKGEALGVGWLADYDTNEKMFIGRWVSVQLFGQLGWSTAPGSDSRAKYGGVSAKEHLASRKMMSANFVRKSRGLVTSKRPCFQA